MSKVKKRSGLTGERNAKRSSVAPRRAGAKVAKRPIRGGPSTAARKSTKATKPVRKAAGKSAAKTAARTVVKRPKKAPKILARKASSATGRGSSSTARKTSVKSRIVVVQERGARGGRLEPIARYAIKRLDPLRKCGPGTSVQHLYRVDESVEGKTRAHLVFFDRHGWYCEHGRTCPAVAPAKKYNGHIARVS